MYWFCSNKAAHLTGYSIEDVYHRLAILQHYIGRSTVVDLTECPRVALYFALKDANVGSECVVYSIDRNKAVSSDVVFADYAFLALPLAQGGIKHRWWRQAGYSVGPKRWQDAQAVRNFDLLKLKGVNCMRFRKQSTDDNLVACLGDLEGTNGDFLASNVRANVEAIARECKLLTPDIQRILACSATVAPNAALESRIDGLMAKTKPANAFSKKVIMVLKNLKKQLKQGQWDTSSDASLSWAEKMLSQKNSPRG